MKRWRLGLLVLLIVLIPVAVVLLEPTGSVLGWLRGEPTYLGLPTTYWRRDCEMWQPMPVMTRSPGPDGVIVQRQTAWGRPLTFFEHVYLFQFQSANVVLVAPPLLEGDPEAEPVLRELLEDPSPHVWRMAQEGLDAIRKIR